MIDCPVSGSFEFPLIMISGFQGNTYYLPINLYPAAMTIQKNGFIITCEKCCKQPWKGSL